MRELRAAPLRRRLTPLLGRRGATLAVVVEEALRAGCRPFLVGGPVRDLLRGAPIGDLDVLVDCDSAALARRVARRLGGRAIVHARFLTARVAIGAQGDGLHVDLSRARSERYPSPGALPEVQPASIEMDLARRDFSVHAMALPLAGEAGTVLLDPFGGRADLARRALRILHPGSFRDDPTRLLRAVRYAARLDFVLEASSARAFREARDGGALDTVSGARLASELERLLEEPDPARAAARCARAGVLDALQPGWELGAAARRALARFGRAATRPPWPEVAEPEVRRRGGWSLLFVDALPAVRRRALARLGVRGRRAVRIEDALRARSRLRRASAPQISDGSLDATLAGLEEAELLLLWCVANAAAARRLVRWARGIRHRPAEIDGHVVRDLGADGPEIGAALRAARRRQLDGRPVDSAWLRRWLARRRQMG